MKLLFENWRAYLTERIDYMPPEEEEEPDMGQAFETISKLDIIENPSQNLHQKNSLLDMFDKLKETDNTDPIEGITINNILKSLYTFSGNADDFKYTSKKEAIRDYIEPYRYGEKSLKDYHEEIKEIVRRETRHTKISPWEYKSEKTIAPTIKEPKEDKTLWEELSRTGKCK